MSRTIALVALLVVGLAFAAFLIARGSSIFSDQGQDGAPDVGVDDGQSAGPSFKPPQFTNWPAPKAVLVLSGEAHGYLEPCGCSEKQSGGVARRSDLFKQLRAKGWPVAGLDLGGTVKRSRKQSELKFAAITDALRKLDYRGIGLGPEELRLQPDFLLSEHTPSEDGSPGLAFLGANETFFGFPGMEGGPKDFVIAELGGLKIGTTMILGESHQRGLFPEGASNDVTFTPPAEALREVVSKFEDAGTDYNVLLSYADRSESTALAKQFPQFDVVVSAGGPEDPEGKPEQVGDSWLVTVGHKGKYAGVLGFYPSNEEEPLRYELVDLSRDHFAHDPAMDEIMREYQQTLADNLSEVFADLPESVPPREGTYVGATKCGECHKQAFAKWSESGHANAYLSLTKGRPHHEGTWVDRTKDPECLACHVTGWHPQEVYPYVSGFLPKEIAAERNEPHRSELLKGQQCENCHGPGSEHVAVMEKWQKNPRSVSQQDQFAAKSRMTVSLQTARESLCVRCHDYENSPDFDFDTYWAKINHKGLRN